MTIISVNVGMPREVVWKGLTVQTGIFKEPVNGPVVIRELNLEGDRQADLTVHGGPQKAVYAYPAEHYEYWKRELPDVTFSWGEFGENLTTEGLNEDNLHIGDRLKIGSAMLMVTQPRLPCYKLALKFERGFNVKDMIKRFLISRRSGFYFSVIDQSKTEPGEVRAGSEVEIVHRDPNQVTVADISRLYFSKAGDHRDLLHRAMNVGALPQNWKDDLMQRAQAH